MINYAIRTRDYNVPIIDVEIEDSKITSKFVLGGFITLFQETEKWEDLVTDFDYLIRLAEHYERSTSDNPHIFVKAYMANVAVRWNLYLEVT